MKKWKYILIVAFGALSYGPLQTFAKVAYGQGYTPAEITLVQALFGAVILWIMALINKIRKGNLKLIGNWKLLLAGTSMGVSAYLSYAAVQYIPVALSIVLLMQVSWMSPLAEWLVFRKKPSKNEIIAAFFIVIGAVLAVNLLGIGDFDISITGLALGVSAPIFYTIYIMATSRLGNETPILEKSALMFTGSALMIFMINFNSITTSTNLDLGLAKYGIFLAVFGTVIPPICFTTGMPKIGAGLSSILLTLELPAVALCAYLVLGEVVNFVQAIGMAIMLGAIIWLNLVQAKKEKRDKNNQDNHRTKSCHKTSTSKCSI